MGGGSFLVGGGQFSGPSPAPMGQGLSQVLGLQGGELPGVASAPGVVMPVGIVFDTSDQVSRALIPARGWSGRTTIVAAANVLFWKLQAAQNGVVIERLRLTGSGGAMVLPVGVTRSPANVFAGLVPVPVFQGAENIGGLNLSPAVGPYVTNAVSLGFGSVFVLPSYFDGNPREIFVPPGGSLGLQTYDVGVDIAWEVVFREVPQ